MAFPFKIIIFDWLKALIGDSNKRRKSYAERSSSSSSNNSSHQFEYLLPVGAALLCLNSLSSVNDSSVFHAETWNKDRFEAKYEIKEKIGTGGFSTVSLATDKITGEAVAAKFFDPKCASLQSIRHERQILTSVGKHPHIVSLRDWIEISDDPSSQIIMIMDLVKGGELFDFIVNHGSLSESDASRMLRQVALGLAHIHSRSVTHRDIKPENVLLTSNSSSGAAVKIADFGLSSDSSVTSAADIEALVQNPEGTWAYWAPETILKKRPQGPPVDMWAFGLLLYIVLMGYHPFDKTGTATDAEVLCAIVRDSYDTSTPWYDEISSEAKDLLQKLLVKDPKLRLTATQVLDHPWITNSGVTKASSHQLPAKRLEAFQKLTQLRANVMAVLLSHSQMESNSGSNTRRRNTVETNAVLSNMNLYKQTFELYDTDRSGYISKDELRNVMRAVGQDVSDEVIDAVMAEVDTDGDGRLSLEEFSQMMQQQLMDRAGDLSERELKAAFTVFDENCDGVISSEELLHVISMLGGAVVSREEANELLEQADTNHDGQIDYNEFAALMGQRRTETSNSSI